MKLLHAIFITFFGIAVIALICSGSTPIEQSIYPIPAEQNKEISSIDHPLSSFDSTQSLAENAIQFLGPLFHKQRNKIGKFSVFQNVISSIGWQNGKGISSDRKTIFKIYFTRVAQSIPDPRLHLLSSRAHPPTFCI